MRVAHVGERRRTYGCLPLSGQRDAELVERIKQVLGVAVDAERPGLGQLVLAVAATEEADAEHPGSACREQVPDRISDHVAVLAPHAHPLLTGKEEVRLGLGAKDVVAGALGLPDTRRCFLDRLAATTFARHGTPSRGR